MPHKDPIVRSAWQKSYRHRNASRLHEYQQEYAVSGKKAEAAKRDYTKHSAAYKARAKKRWDSLPYWQQKFHRALIKARSKNIYIGDLHALEAYYREVYSRPTAVCVYCRGEFAIEQIVLDHKEPYALKGAHEVSNLTVSCLDCNYAKRAKPFATWQAML